MTPGAGEKLSQYSRWKPWAALLGSAALVITGYDNWQYNSSIRSLENSARKFESADSALVSDVASQLAGENVNVHCGNEFFQNGENTTAATLGYFKDYQIRIPFIIKHHISTDDIYLKPRLCRSIAKANMNQSLAGTKNPDKSVHALHVLGHELEHAAGTGDEATAECLSMQRLPVHLESLGFSDSDIDYVFYSISTAAYSAPSAEYLSDECRPGGSLDLGINGPFPAYTIKETP